MAAKYIKCVSNGLSPVVRNKPKLFQHGFLNFRKFSMLKVLCAKQKYTIQLQPDVEKLLDSGEIKHRKHPGIKKTLPFVIPEILKSSIDKIMSYENEKVLLEEAQALCACLKSRKLPIESNEIKRRIKAMVPSFDNNFEDLSDILNKRQLKIMKRRIASEINRWKPIEYNRRTSLAYLVGRLSANYASTSYVFQQLRSRIPSFQPTTYFDFGCGVGSSLWAAHSCWSHTIKEYFCVDASADMNELCQNLLTDQVTEEKYINTVFFRQFLPASENVKYDLVVSAFSLLDLSSFEERLRIIDTLWRKTKEILVLIEYGTVAGFHSVIDARDYILKIENDCSPEFSYYSSGAYVVSPCPHDSNCPKIMEKLNSSCGFIVPYQVYLSQKQSQVVEKDWISYVILKKGQRPEDDITQPRLVKPVLKKVKHVFCRLCCADGKLHEVIVTKGKHGRHAYRCARECNQGDILPITITPIQTSLNEG